MKLSPRTLLASLPLADSDNSVILVSILPSPVSPAPGNTSANTASSSAADRGAAAAAHNSSSGSGARVLAWDLPTSAPAQAAAAHGHYTSSSPLTSSTGGLMTATATTANTATASARADAVIVPAALAAAINALPEANFAGAPARSETPEVESAPVGPKNAKTALMSAFVSAYESSDKRANTHASAGSGDAGSDAVSDETATATGDVGNVADEDTDNNAVIDYDTSLPSAPAPFTLSSTLAALRPLSLQSSTPTATAAASASANGQMATPSLAALGGLQALVLAVTSVAAAADPALCPEDVMIFRNRVSVEKVPVGQFIDVAVSAALFALSAPDSALDFNNNNNNNNSSNSSNTSSAATASTALPAASKGAAPPSKGVMLAVRLFTHIVALIAEACLPPAVAAAFAADPVAAAPLLAALPGAESAANKINASASASTSASGSSRGSSTANAVSDVTALLSSSLGNLANCLRTAALHAPAAARYQAVLALQRALGDERGAAMTLVNLAGALLGAGNGAEAARTYSLAKQTLLSLARANADADTDTDTQANATTSSNASTSGAGDAGVGSPVAAVLASNNAARKAREQRRAQRAQAAADRRAAAHAGEGVARALAATGDVATAVSAQTEAAALWAEVAAAEAAAAADAQAEAEVTGAAVTGAADGAAAVARAAAAAAAGTARARAGAVLALGQMLLSQRRPAEAAPALVTAAELLTQVKAAEESGLIAPNPERGSAAAAAAAGGLSPAVSVGAGQTVGLLVKALNMAATATAMAGGAAPPVKAAAADAEQQQQHVAGAAAALVRAKALWERCLLEGERAGLDRDQGVAANIKVCEQKLAAMNK